MTLVRTSVDAWVTEDAPSANRPQSVKLQMAASSPNRKFAYIFFARPFPATNVNALVVKSATLNLNLAEGWSGSQTITVERIQQSWREGKINWNNRPNVALAPDSHYGQSATITNGQDKDAVAIDVTQMLADVAGGSAWYGVRLSVSASGTRKVYSSDHPNTFMRPKLQVDWVEAPDPPSNLAPGGGRAIGVSHPTLDWQYSERGGRGNLAQSTQAAYQVLISSAPDFSVFPFDTGMVSDTVSRLDLSLTSFPGIAPDALLYWKVRVWDDQLVPSEYSEVQSFTRKTKGTLEITNPADPPDNQVEETTPPIVWDFQGQTQEAYALTLSVVTASGDREIHATGKTISDDSSYTIPSKGHGNIGRLIRSGLTYRVRVRVYDDIERQSIAGDPDYVVDSQVFTYVRSGVPSPTTNLIAVADGARVTLTWERSTAPDFFSLRVNGVEVEDRIDPADVLVSGTTYQYKWWGAIPRLASTYEVEAVVNDGGVRKHSDGNGTATVTTNPIGIWLVDPEDSTNVQILGQDAADLTLREVGTTFDVIGSSRPVRITDALMGYSGTVSGQVVGSSVRDDFLELKYRQKVLRVILSDVNIPIVLEECAIPPTPIPGEPIYNASLSFFQVDEFFEPSFLPPEFEPDIPDPDPDPEVVVTDDSSTPGEAIPGAAVPGA